MYFMVEGASTALTVPPTASAINANPKKIAFPVFIIPYSLLVALDEPT
jgi:hypothetical protein